MDNTSGSISFDNLICKLYTTDFDPDYKKAGDPNANELDDYVKDLNLIQNKLKDKGSIHEYIPYSVLPKDISSQTRKVLFHERVHYWQLLSSSAQQFRLVSILDSIGTRVALLNGHRERILDNNYPSNDETLEGIQVSIDSMNSNFSSINVNKNNVEITDVIMEKPFTAMPLFFAPHKSGGNTVLPVYGALLGSHLNPEILIPFSGNNLIECAAYITELLWAQEKIPQLSLLETIDKVYLGVWEFWRRVYGHRYGSEEELALSFLAAVDYAINLDVINPFEYDEEYLYEMTNIPYRFGKLAFRMQNQALLSCRGKTVSQAITDYQNEIASFCSWPTLKQTACKLAAFLTRLVVRGVAKDIPFTEANKRLIFGFFDSDNKTYSNSIDGLEPIWSLIREAQPETITVFPIGISIICEMLNATVYRISGPCHFAAPHIYSKELSKAFPLPFILIGGKYFFDETLMAYKCDFHSPTKYVDLKSDCISLATLSPLVEGKVFCGLKQKGYDCYYTREGFQCPCRDQGDTREEDIRCHWKRRVEKIGLS